MAKKSTMNKAADAVKTVAGTALGAAAAAATQVVVESVVGAVSKGGAKLDAAGRTAEVGGQRGFKADIAQPKEEISSSKGKGTGQKARCSCGQKESLRQEKISTAPTG
jgi:hypothetical protein